MGKTFISASTDRVLVVEGYHGAPYLEIVDGGGDMKSFRLDKSDAPALMQAIAECLPPIPDIVRDGSYEAYMAVVETYLGKAVRALEAEIAKSKAQAKLEAEALELFNVRMSVDAERYRGVWDTLTEFSSVELRDDWLAVARKAREMRAEK